MRRRTVFAAPFVLIAATGCAGRTYTNPPPPRDISVEECRAITEGTPCQGERDSSDHRDPHFCSIEPADNKCGMQGYECRAKDNTTYAWTALTLTEGCPAAPDAGTEPAPRIAPTTE